ncbi:hypothetical protein [Facilibium subflavum]|uniref:hypothetical protein n=1 Tax=Facilibium subflavum TaxID=2219058 RepID=UPI000E6592F4|nr:hypothetical protein [Facilibium subflavum]
MSTRQRDEILQIAIEAYNKLINEIQSSSTGYNSEWVTDQRKRQYRRISEDMSSKYTRLLEEVKYDDCNDFYNMHLQVQHANCEAQAIILAKILTEREISTRLLCMQAIGRRIHTMLGVYDEDGALIMIADPWAGKIIMVDEDREFSHFNLADTNNLDKTYTAVSAKESTRKPLPEKLAAAFSKLPSQLNTGLDGIAQINSYSLSRFIELYVDPRLTTSLNEKLIDLTKGKGFLEENDGEKLLFNYFIRNKKALNILYSDDLISLIPFYIAKKLLKNDVEQENLVLQKLGQMLSAKDRKSLQLACKINTGSGIAKPGTQKDFLEYFERSGLKIDLQKNITKAIEF